jgi:polar amino acid transport system substrate-binding protein
MAAPSLSRALWLGLSVSVAGTACASVQATTGAAPSNSASPAADVAGALVETVEVGSVLSGVYTVRQASRGENVFRRVCATCHDSTEFGGRRFRFRWRNQTVGSIYDYLFENMPQGNPGSLETEEYVDVLAYFLSLNEYPTGAEELPADPPALRSIRVEDPS